MTVYHSANTRSSYNLVAGKWLSDWGNVALVGLAVFVAVYLVSLQYQWGGGLGFELWRELAFIPVMLLGVLFALRTARRREIDFQTSRAWLIIGLALALNVLADGVWAYHTLFRDASPFPSIADLLYILSIGLLVVGVLRFPTPALSPRSRNRLLLDAGIVLVALATLTGYFVIGEPALRLTSLSLNALLLLVYPFLNLLGIIAIFSMMARRPRAGTVGVLSFLAAGVIFWTLANLGWSYLEARDQYELGGLLYGLWMLGHALVATSPQRHYDAINRNVPQTAPGRKAGQIRVLVPYVATATVCVVIVIAALPEIFSRFGAIVFLILVLLGLFVSRYVLTLSDNASFQVEQAKRESEERFQALVEHSSDMITVLDRDFVCRFQSPSSVELFGTTPEEFVGRSLLEWVHRDDEDRVSRALSDFVRSGNDRAKFEWRMAIPNGSFVQMESVVSNELKNPLVRGLVLNSRDIVERKELEDRLTYHAYHDALTGLPNRAAFMNTMMRALRNSRGGRATALMFIDLDHFKEVNDTFGHEVGDELLKQVAQRLLDSTRPGDAPGRFAGDEFTILLSDLRNPEEAFVIANRMKQRLQEPFPVAGTTVMIVSSIGVAWTDDPETTPSELLRHADSAMYAAKREGRNQIRVFEPWMEAQLTALERDRTVAGVSSTTCSEGF